MALGGARRSPGHQESRGQANPGRQETERPGEICAYRHAGREPAGRPVVHLRLHQPRTARVVEGVYEPGQTSCGEAPQSLRLRSASLVRPYILRRLKTDKTVIADLPDKTEVKAFCQLSRKQAALYQQAVKELAEQLDDRREGIQRKGVVLSFLMRFKQICNHPSQWLGDGAWAEEDSGKWARLRDIAEVIAARQEKVLVFTQFREVTAPLAAFLGSVFGRPGLVLHGETPVGKPPGVGAPISGRRGSGVFRAFAQGRGLWPESHRRLARGPLRPVVEPGGGEPSHRSRLPHRPEEERAGAQVCVPRNRGGEDRPTHRVEAADSPRTCWKAAPNCC